MKSIFLLMAFLCLPVFSANTLAMNTYQRCLIETLADANSRMTAGEIKEQCKKNTTATPPALPPPVTGKTALANRLVEEKSLEDNAFVITPYLPNYFLFASYNTADLNTAPFEQAFPNDEILMDATEAKFQISFKFPVVKNLFGNNGDIYAAYTNRSFWQLYNDNSAPFRETNHQPEVWLRFYNDWELWGIRNVINDIGFVHQSNGRSRNLSRSWNRIYARFVFEKNNLAVAFQPWYRIPEDKANDDNPDIEDYLGNFEVISAYKLGEHTFSLMFRNNLDFDTNRGAAQLDWSFPIHGHLRGYVQWFNGYGESLIDYNENVNSIGFGIKLTDWL